MIAQRAIAAGLVLGLCGHPVGAQSGRQRVVEATPPIFLVTTIEPSGARVTKAATLWEGGVDEDTVVVVLARRLARVDSVRLLGRSGPLVLNGDLPDVTRADSLGRWWIAPRSQLASLAGLTRGDSVVLGALLPMRLASLARRLRPSRPYLTRIAVEVWSGGTVARAELDVGQPI
jgi:hypothetical protein